MPNTCCVCGKSFGNWGKYTSYCSYSCYYKNHKKKKVSISKQCAVCGKTFNSFKKTQIYCSKKCSSSVAHKKYRRNQSLNHLREFILMRDDYRCTICKSDNDLVVHHKDESGGKPNENNAPDNLITLCSSCHSKLHNNTGFLTKCISCGKEFWTTTYKQSLGKGKYCSAECSQKAQIGTHKPKPITRQIPTTCLTCGKEFMTTQYYLDNGRDKYCSKQCSSIGLKSNLNLKKKSNPSRVYVNCQVCGKEFHVVISGIESGRGKYCSRTCYYKSRVKT